MIYHFKNEQPSNLLRGHLNLGGHNENTSLEVTNHYLEKNGECWIPIMGEIHYGRVNREIWKDELLKIKAGGITVIAAYVFWIFHEEEEGQFNFTGNNDLRHFLTLIQECGLEVVVRIGPWCHAELRNGGFPDWLVRKGCRTRTDDQEYRFIPPRAGMRPTAQQFLNGMFCLYLVDTRMPPGKNIPGSLSRYHTIFSCLREMTTRSAKISLSPKRRMLMCFR